MTVTEPMPAVFFGHGSPMNAIEENQFIDSWQALTNSFQTPRAIVCISAHWLTEGARVTAMAKPPTIHDFRGFPAALNAYQYPAPGSPELAKRVADILLPFKVSADLDWGLDHGAWSVLCRIYPKADIPVVQLSIDGRQPHSYHYEIGKKLAPLRDEGVLIMGSGNVVHNLRAMNFDQDGAFDWAARFDQFTRTAIEKRDAQALIDYEKQGADARQSLPTDEHYLPLLYVLGASRPTDELTFPVQGFQYGSISMLSVKVG